jgi:hypothetical protein
MMRDDIPAIIRAAIIISAGPPLVADIRGFREAMSGKILEDLAPSRIGTGSDNERRAPAMDEGRQAFERDAADYRMSENGKPSG